MEITNESLRIKLGGDKETGKNLLANLLKEDEEILEAVIVARHAYNFRKKIPDPDSLKKKVFKNLIDSDSPEDFIKKMKSMKDDLLREVDLEEEREQINNIINEFKRGK